MTDSFGCGMGMDSKILICSELDTVDLVARKSLVRPVDQKIL